MKLTARAGQTMLYSHAGSNCRGTEQSGGRPVSCTAEHLVVLVAKRMSLRPVSRMYLREA